MSFEEQVLTYTPNYRVELTNIMLNKVYSFNYKFGTRDKNNILYKFIFKWEPTEGEINFNLNKNFTIIDCIPILVTNQNVYVNQVKIIDNYGNIHVAYNNHNREAPKIFSSSIIENKEGQEVLSDQVIDFIKDNNIVSNNTITSEHIKQIQKIAGTGKEKKITYTIDDTCEIRDISYDRNDIIKDLIISYPGEDPWEKAKELYSIYEKKYEKLNDEREEDIKLLRTLVHTKNNIMNLISRNKDIDDEDILELLRIKKIKLTSIERQIDYILEKNSTRYEEIIKLKLLISKLDLIPKKECGTEFI